MSSLINILILSLLAGLATGIGGLCVIFKRPSAKLFGFLIGFSAGVMLVIALFGLMKEAWENAGFLTAVLGFAVGTLAMFALDVTLPHIHFAIKEKGLLDPKLFTTGMLIALGIALHNFPEGISIGASYLYSPKFGLLIAIAIALHNIPEGIAVALPIYKSGASKLTSFKIALFSGLMEPVGAMVAALFLIKFNFLIPICLAFAAGVMVFITLDELIPLARKYGHEHFTALGIILGLISMFLLSGIFNI